MKNHRFQLLDDYLMPKLVSCCREGIKARIEVCDVGRNHRGSLKTRYLVFSLLLVVGPDHPTSAEEAYKGTFLSLAHMPSVLLRTEKAVCKDVAAAEPVQFCGDGVCEDGEDCGNCPEDCGECPPPPPPPEWCGDGICNNGEDCGSCSGDCGACPPPPPVCGDGSCNGDETCGTCSLDCGACPPPPPVCGDGACNGTEDCSTCSVDCGACPPPPPVCGDGACNGTEDCSSCSVDCGSCPPVCGDGACTPSLEDCGLCPGDCPCWDPEFPVCQNQQCVPPVCGDAACTGVENCSSCEADCGVCPSPVCGDGTCSNGEDCSSCQADCGACAPPAELATTSDESYDGENVSAQVVAELSGGEGGEVRVEATVTSEDSGAVLATGSMSGYPAASLNVAAPAPMDTTVEVNAADGGTAIVVTYVASWIVAGVVSKIKNWFKKIRIGGSRLCYLYSQELPGDLGTFCEYMQKQPCPVTCASAFPLFTHRKDGPFGCYTEVAFNVAWKKDGNAVTCGRFGVHVPWSPCVCAEWRLN